MELGRKNRKRPALLGSLLLGLRSLSRHAGFALKGGRKRIGLSDVLAHTSEALLFEVRHGCSDMASRLEAIRRLLQDESFRVDATDHQDHVDQLVIDLLRLGLLDELLKVIEQKRLPVQSDMAAFLTFSHGAYVSAFERGQAAKSWAGSGELFTLGCIVWGETYIRNFLRYNLRSLLADGNLPALREQGRVIFHIITDELGAGLIRQDPTFESLSALTDVEFTLIPANLISILSGGYSSRHFYVLYGMLDHCSVYFSLGAGSHLFMIPVDSVVANGSLRAMADLRHAGYECCGGGNIVATAETFLVALDKKYPGPILDIATGELATLAVEHAHQYFTSQIVTAANHDFGRHPRELFWIVPNGVAIRSIFIHPLFTTTSALQRYRRKHFANIDYGMIPRMFETADTIKVIEDAKMAYVNNFVSQSRRFESTGRPFAVEDFVRCHDQSYTVQKSLFMKMQTVPCKVTAWSLSEETEEVVRDIVAHLGHPVGTPGTAMQANSAIDQLRGTQ